MSLACSPVEAYHAARAAAAKWPPGLGKYLRLPLTIAMTEDSFFDNPLSSIDLFQLYDHSMSSASEDENSADQGGPDAQVAKTQITEDEWDRLRAPFSRHAYVIDSRATGRVEANLPIERDDQEKSQASGLNQAIIDLRLRIEAIQDRLDVVLGPERYSFRFEPGPNDSGERTLFCHLQIGAASRTGIGIGSTYRKARKVALSNAALAFGIGASSQVAGPIVAGKESHYDVPSSILEALETRNAPSLWAPEDSA